MSLDSQPEDTAEGLAMHDAIRLMLETDGDARGTVASLACEIDDQVTYGAP
jgi:hypothetical protein